MHFLPIVLSPENHSKLRSRNSARLPLFEYAPFLSKYSGEPGRGKVGADTATLGGPLVSLMQLMLRNGISVAQKQNLSWIHSQPSV